VLKNRWISIVWKNEKFLKWNMASNFSSFDLYSVSNCRYWFLFSIPTVKLIHFICLEFMRKLGRNEKFVTWNKRNFICITNFTILINRVVVWNSIEYSLMITGVVFVISKPANIWLSIGPANIWQHLVPFSAKFHVSFEGFWKNCAPNIDRSIIGIFKRFFEGS